MDIDVDVDVEVEVEVDSFGCLKEASRSVRVLLNGR